MVAFGDLVVICESQLKQRFRCIDRPPTTDAAACFLLAAGGVQGTGYRVKQEKEVFIEPIWPNIFSTT